LCGGIPAEGIIDTFNAPHHIKTIEITETRFEKILGVSVSMKDIWNIIKRLGFEKIEEDLTQTINVTPPFWRSDISIQDDIIEEYARIYGYDNLPTSNLASPIPSQGSENPQTVREHIRDRLVSAGMNETISYSITDLETINLFDSIPNDQQPISIANPMDASKKYLRPTLVPNVLETLSRNRRTDQQNGLRLFEIGRVFLPLQTDEIDSMPVEKEEIVGAITGFSTSTDLWSESGRLMDFFDAKGIVEHTFRGLSGVLSFTKNDGTMYETGKKADIFLNEVLIGQIGELKSDLSEFFDLSTSPVVIFHLSLEAIQTVAQVQFVNYSEPSRYPSSFRDLALISNKEVDSESIVSTIMENKLVADSFPIDKYVGVEVPDGKQSLTVRIIFQSNEKTLSAKEIDRAHIQIIKSLEHRYKISERYS
jgi:phenylalanyl-tRNA synthetase beta chain